MFERYDLIGVDRPELMLSPVRPSDPNTANSIGFAKSEVDPGIIRGAVAVRGANICNSLRAGHFDSDAGTNGRGTVTIAHVEQDPVLSGAGSAPRVFKYIGRALSVGNHDIDEPVVIKIAERGTAT